MPYVRYLILLLVLTGCATIPSTSVEQISTTDGTKGYLAVNLESDWAVEDGKVSRYNLLFGTGTFTTANLRGTAPDTFRMIALSPGRYWWAIGVADHSISFAERMYFDIKANEVTNLGVLYLDFNEKDVRQLDAISQSDHEKTRAVAEGRISVAGVSVTDAVFVERDTSVGMGNTAGGRFDVAFKTERPR